VPLCADAAERRVSGGKEFRFMFDVNAAVADDVSDGSAGYEDQSEEKDLIVLKGGFSTDDGRYKFELKAGGTGEIFYSDFPADSEEFLHEINVETLSREIETAVQAELELRSEQNRLEDSDIKDIREDTASEILEEIFWEEINGTLEDPFFRSFYDDSEWGEEFQTERGTTEEFEEFLELCVLTEREIASPDDYLIIEAETDCESAGLSDCSYYSERLGELVEVACEYFKTSGFRYDYNDGCYDRYSGYSMSSESVSVSLREASKVPAREKMLGMVKLREKLAAMGVAGDVIRRLTAF
jgi:hypothetical protein